MRRTARRVVERADRRSPITTRTARHQFCFRVRRKCLPGSTRKPDSLSSWRQMGSRLKPTDSELRHRSSSSVRKTKSCVPFSNPLVEQDLIGVANGIKLFDFAQPTARSMKPDRGGMLAADGRQSLFVRLPLAAQLREYFDQCQLIRANAAAILKQRGFDVKKLLRP